MARTLEDARASAERVRFASDRSRHHSYGDASRAEHLRDAFYKTGLLITDQTTPALSKSFDLVCDRLGLPRDRVEAFVYSSPDVQAECFSSSLDRCTVRFSSALVNLLDEAEFAFVAGHELGHFLFGHGGAQNEGTPSIEHFMQLRFQEISVDRLGLVACSDLKTAVQAMIKTVSGLDSRHLRYNAGQFISQLSSLSDPSQGDALESTHPSMFMRCRALLWFSMDTEIDGYPGSVDRKRIDALDNRVAADFTKYVDGPAEQRIEKTKEDLAIWLAASVMVADGKLATSEQKTFDAMFGTETLEKLVNFLSGLNKSEVDEAIYERVKASREELEGVIPDRFPDVYSEIESRIRRAFS
jgi:hypothetical protein